MNRIRSFMEKMFSERPSRPDNIFVGLFEVAMGAFLLLPFDSFAPTLHFSPVPGNTAVPIYSWLEEWHFGIAMLILGLGQIGLAYFKKWDALRRWVLPTAVLWIFVTVGYAITLPKGTPIVFFGFFTIWVVYQFLELSYWCSHDPENLRNKKNIGTI